MNLHVVYGFAAGNERIDKTEQILINVYNNMGQNMSEMNLIGGDFNIVDANMSLSEQWSLTDLAVAYNDMSPTNYTRGVETRIDLNFF